MDRNIIYFEMIYNIYHFKIIYNLYIFLKRKKKRQSIKFVSSKRFFPLQLSVIIAAYNSFSVNQKILAISALH